MNAISIVGAGPGAPDLLTQRAFKRIKSAEVLVWTDSLISPEIANLATENCECISTSKLTLEEIVELLIERHRQEKRIVRLHDGDPCLYGAIAEQINLLSRAGIGVEVIPGISAYQALSAKLQTELTIPGVVQTIVLSRAEGRTNVPHAERLEALAKLRTSLCLYLSARHVEEVEKILLKHYPSETKVAIGYRVSWRDELIKIVNLSEMAKISKENKLIRTTLYIISPALSLHNQRSKLYNPDHNHLFRSKI